MHCVFQNKTSRLNYYGKKSDCKWKVSSSSIGYYFINLYVYTRGKNSGAQNML